RRRAPVGRFPCAPTAARKTGPPCRPVGTEHLPSVPPERALRVGCGRSVPRLTTGTLVEASPASQLSLPFFDSARSRGPGHVAVRNWRQGYNVKLTAKGFERVTHCFGAADANPAILTAGSARADGLFPVSPSTVQNPGRQLPDCRPPCKSFVKRKQNSPVRALRRSALDDNLRNPQLAFAPPGGNSALRGTGHPLAVSGFLTFTED